MKTISALPFLFALPASAALTINLPGHSEAASWSQMRNSNPFWAADGYPTQHFNAATPWPAPVDANLSGSTSGAVFNKISGGGYFAGGSLYDAGIPGLFSVSDGSPAPNLATIIFQLDVGTNIGVPPTLSYNGGSQRLTPEFTFITAGTYPTFNFTTGQSFPSRNHAWQWNLTGLYATSYEIQWGSLGNNHLTQYEINLTTGDTFVQAIPEPATFLSALCAAVLTLTRRRRE